jgi:hypothetical protein
MARGFYSCPACGNDIKVEGFNRRDVDSRIAYAERQGRTCWACDKKAGQAAGAAFAAANALPAPTGSDKQIAWAESLRANAIRAIDKDIAAAAEQFRSANLSAAAMQEISDAIALLRAEVVDQIEAKFWIDNKDRLGSKYIQDQFRKRGKDLCPRTTAESAR